MQRQTENFIGIILCILVVVGVFIYALTNKITRLQAELVAQQQQLEAATAEYRRQLALNQQLQKERDAAKEAIGYKKESDAVYHANLIGDFIKFLGDSKRLNTQVETLNFDKLEDFEKYAKHLEETMQHGIGILGRIIIRNTEPVEEKKEK
jgi:hypothetical protein